MPGNKPRYQICSKEHEDPDGIRVRTYEVYEVFDVDGIEKFHRNNEKGFETEQEAKAWIEQQCDKRC